MKLLSPEALAAALGISEHTLANWRAAGQGPPYARVGDVIRYRDTDVEDGDRGCRAYRGEKEL